MTLTELCDIIEDKSGINTYRWWVEADEFTEFPHAVVAKIGSGEGLFADNNRYFEVAKAEMYLAMADDRKQDEYEAAMDRTLTDLNIAYSYRIGYNREEAIVVKIYEFEFPEKEHIS